MGEGGGGLSQRLLYQNGDGVSNGSKGTRQIFENAYAVASDCLSFCFSFLRRLRPEGSRGMGGAFLMVSLSASSVSFVMQISEGVASEAGRYSNV